MHVWTSSELIRSVGSHVASTPEFRIQILRIRDDADDLWPVAAGGVLIIVLQGECRIRTEETDFKLSDGGQILLGCGEKFSVSRTDSTMETIAQFIWGPGISKAE